MTHRTLSLGKCRALQRASAADGLFNIVAIDHQDALKRAINPAEPTSVSDETMTQFKLDVVSALIDEVSGVLLDPVYGAFQAIASDILGNRGLLVELEKADYQMAPMPLDLEIDPNWSVAKIKQMNADGVKVFFYYNPSHQDHAARQEARIRQIAADCARHELPFYAEPIVYRHEDDPPESDTWLVVEAAQRIAQLAVDVLKLEFPVDVRQEPDERAWLDACRAITERINIPWVLLSAGVSFDMFVRQLEIACRAGASGFIVGRALWGEAAQITNREKRLSWLQHTGQKRLTLLNAIATTYGMPWHNRYEGALPPVTTATFQQYANSEAVQYD